MTMKFRVHIGQLTKRNDDTRNSWIFDDPIYAIHYLLKIRRVQNIGRNDALWRLELSCQNKDPEDTWSRVDVLQVDLANACDVGLNYSLSAQVNGSLPRLLYKSHFRGEESWLFAASPRSYCELDITRLHTLIPSIQ